MEREFDSQMKCFSPFVILLAFLLLNPVPATLLHGREARPNIVLLNLIFAVGLK